MCPECFKKAQEDTAQFYIQFIRPLPWSPLTACIRWRICGISRQFSMAWAGRRLSLWGFHCVLREVAVQKGPGAVVRFRVKGMWAIKSKQLKLFSSSLFLINRAGVSLDPGAVAGLGENVVLEGDRQKEWPRGNRGKQVVKIDGAFGH